MPRITTFIQCIEFVYTIMLEPTGVFEFSNMNWTSMVPLSPTGERPWEIDSNNMMNLTYVLVEFFVEITWRFIVVIHCAGLLDMPHVDISFGEGVKLDNGTCLRCAE